MVRFRPRAVAVGAFALLALAGAGCSKSESPPATTSTTAAASSTTKAGSAGGTGGTGGTVSRADFVASLEDSGLGPEVADCIVAQFDQAEVDYPPATGGTDEQEQLLDTATNDCVQDVIDSSGDAGAGGGDVEVP